MSDPDSNRLDEGLRKLLEKAIDLDRRGMKKEAARYYLRASKILIKLSNAASLRSVRKHYLDRAQECVDRVRYLSGIKKKSRGPVEGISTIPTKIVEETRPLEGDEKRQDEEDDSGQRLNEMIADTIITERPEGGMSDVAGLDKAKQAINEAIALFLPNRIFFLFSPFTFFT